MDEIELEIDSDSQHLYLSCDSPLHGRIGNYSVEGAFNPSRKSVVVRKLKSTGRLLMSRHLDRTIFILFV
jgi:hypothetical protein